MSTTSITARRALEALRAGVPNRDAVAALGTSQDEIVERVLGSLSEVESLPGSGGTPAGILIGGDFGTGKSHLLEYLAHVAAERRFVVSKVVISKETPLHDPVKMYRAAVENATVPGKRGDAVIEIATGLAHNSSAYIDFYRWVHSAASGLNQRFAATLALHEHLSPGDQDFIDQIVRFWAGDRLAIGDLKRRLKERDESEAFDFESIRERELSLQRFRFLARLIKAAGYAGWLVLIDEVELIGRYSILARAKSYAEIARWMKPSRFDSKLPIATVLAMTEDFGTRVLQGGNAGDKDDLERVPAKLRARQKPEDDVLAGEAESGMRLIQREMMKLRHPDRDEIDRCYERIRGIHASAYGWQPPEVVGIERLRTTRMRQYVRAWINEWDLRRLDPSFEAHTKIEEVRTDYAEEPELEEQQDDESIVG